MNTRRAWIWMVCWSVVLALGCSYKTLSFFFDGVPDPQEKKQKVRGVQQSVGATVPAAYYQHAPYAARECDSCHNRAMTNNLVVPKERLCFTCHEFEQSKQYIHGPLASGGCVICHDPHNSRYPRLLVSEPKTFCFYCHDPDGIAKTESHARTDIQCTDCHDAHMSDKKYLLK